MRRFNDPSTSIVRRVSVCVLSAQTNITDGARKRGAQRPGEVVWQSHVVVPFAAAHVHACIVTRQCVWDW